MDAGLAAVLVALLTAPVATIITWMLNRKKSGADIVNTISEAGQTAVESISMVLETVRSQLEEVQAENQKLQEGIQELKRQNEQLIRENVKLREDLKALKNQNDALMQQIHDMRVSYEQSSQHDN